MRYEQNDILFKSIKEMPVAETPRGKMASLGSKSLSDLELMCSILGRGTKDRPVQEIALDVLDCISRNNQNLTMESFNGIKGLGTAQKTVICAALELGRRIMPSHSRYLRDAKDAFTYVDHYGDRDQEYFICIYLNGAMEVIENKVITIGLVNRTLVHPREVFSYAIEKRATSVIIAHNHPSGNLMPSDDDFEVTATIKKAGDLLGIRLLDHLIFNGNSFHSLKESGEFYFA